eukprot:Plantae.Rhodophyta-Rhodochaete_pulchella.ctg1686.p1 GENE.Plantae.Rhodophyta-Rhodochaete_pulchella.ctg1686~~Plantae.Rhodophyta-Rhodochaete_pulchella.ctg1686.p1  ORF type:complete len:247 (+),score=32.00 Plantae.Rhodophyta-Rhodochaete_pulchella.ctg1686:80-820(+)
MTDTMAPSRVYPSPESLEDMDSIHEHSSGNLERELLRGTIVRCRDIVDWGEFPTPPVSNVSSRSSSVSPVEDRRVEWEHSTESSSFEEKQTCIIKGLTRTLLARCNRNEHRILLENVKDSTRMFFSVRKPAVPLELYIRRLVKHARCSNSVFIMAMVYLERLEERRESMGLTELNVHRILTTSVLVAAKFSEDTHYNNTHFARAGGVATVDEMNRLEAAVLRILNFGLFVRREEFESMRSILAPKR